MSLFDTPSKSPQRERPSLFQPEWGGTEGSEEAPLASICVTAILAVGGGVLSWLCFLSDLFWFFPVVTFLLMVWSVWSIRQSQGGRTGIGLVAVALFLMMVPVTAIPTAQYLYRQHLIRQGRAFAEEVFSAAKRGDLLALDQFKLPHFARPDVTDEIGYWRRQIADESAHHGLHQNFINNPMIRSFGGWGDNISVRYVKTVGTMFDAATNEDSLGMIFAATVEPENGEKETCLFSLLLNRSYSPTSHVCGWSLKSFPIKALDPKDGL